MLMAYFEQVEETTAWLRARIGVPEVAIVLGSGLGNFAERLNEPTSIPYTDIPHWPATAVIGHEGRLVAGTLHGRRVLALAGRVHFYEGHGMGTVTFGTRVIGRLGVKILILTNAAGGITTTLTPGTLMVMDDHLNLLGTNPLVGSNDERFGPRFPDMTEVYSARLRLIAADAAQAAGLTLGHGVYAAVHGPSYETPAEIRYLRTIGADAVGMSTVPEVILARFLGLRVAACSVITNLAAGMTGAELSHRETKDMAPIGGARLATVLRKVFEDGMLDG